MPQTIELLISSATIPNPASGGRSYIKELSEWCPWKNVVVT